MKIVAPCRDCLRRKLLCHGSCEVYKAYVAENERIAEARRRKQEAYTDRKEQAFWKKLQREIRRKR